VLKPYDFQEVVPRTGGIPLRTRPEPRRTYHALELDRWRQYLGMPLNLEPKFYPADGKPAGWNKPPGWMVIAAQEAGLDAPLLSHALLRALWAEERDTSKPEVRRAIAIENGMDGDALVAAETSPAVQALYRRGGGAGCVRRAHVHPRGRAVLGAGPARFPRPGAGRPARQGTLICR